MVMGVWQLWAFDLFTLIGSYLAIEVFSAQTILSRIGISTFMIPFGVGMASIYLIGKSVGNGNIKAIKHYYRVSMIMGVFLGFVQVIIL